MKLLFALTVQLLLQVWSLAGSTSASPCSNVNDLVFKNGGFECGLFPWRALAATGTTAKLTTPGDSSSTAFTATQHSAPDGVGIGQATLTQLFYLTTGTEYTLKFSTYFSAGNVGFIGVKLNGQPVATVDGSDGQGPGQWNLNTVVFTATQGQQELEFEFEFSAAGVFARVDKINLTPGT